MQLSVLTAKDRKVAHVQQQRCTSRLGKNQRLLLELELAAKEATVLYNYQTQDSGCVEDEFNTRTLTSTGLLFTTTMSIFLYEVLVLLDTINIQYRKAEMEKIQRKASLGVSPPIALLMDAVCVLVRIPLIDLFAKELMAGYMVYKDDKRKVSLARDQML